MVWGVDYLGKCTDLNFHLRFSLKRPLAHLGSELNCQLFMWASFGREIKAIAKVSWETWKTFKKQSLGEMFGKKKSIMNVRAVHALPCFAPTLWFMVGELDCKEIKPVNPKGNQPQIFLGRTDAEAEAPILWHLMWRVDSLDRKSVV